jgi:hypothetical protein
LLQFWNHFISEVLDLFGPDSKVIGQLIGQGLIGLAGLSVDELFDPQVGQFRSQQFDEKKHDALVCFQVIEGVVRQNPWQLLLKDRLNPIFDWFVGGCGVGEQREPPVQERNDVGGERFCILRIDPQMTGELQ